MQTLVNIFAVACAVAIIMVAGYVIDAYLKTTQDVIDLMHEEDD